MKVVLTNNRVFVGKTLLECMLSWIERQHFKCTRGMWKKTFGVVFKILMLGGDVHYARRYPQDRHAAGELGEQPLGGRFNVPPHAMISVTPIAMDIPLVCS